MVNAAHTAQTLIQHYCISDPNEILIEAIAFDRGVLIEEKTINSAEGRLICRQNKGIISINKNIREEGKKRFVKAHELGHFELHRNLQFFICDEQDFIDWHKKSHYETEANEFAAELLMPTPLFRPSCKCTSPNFDKIIDLANQFRSSVTATAIRFVEIGWFPLLLVCSQNGKLIWTRKSSDFNYFTISIGSKISDNSCAIDFFRNGELSKAPQIILPTVWFSDYSLKRSQYFYEQCFAMPRYNSVLSLIWECSL